MYVSVDCGAISYISSYCGACFFFQAEDGIRDLVRSRGLGDVYKRQVNYFIVHAKRFSIPHAVIVSSHVEIYSDHPFFLLSLIHI